MLKIDEYGCILDNSSGDSGDSACRNGIMALFDGPKVWTTCIYIINKQATRYPFKEPWNNPNNFTRDQLICLVAGMWRNGQYQSAYSLYESHAARFFFAQNIDRDYSVISRKHPYPHFYTQMETGKRVFSWFDYRDPIWSPDDIWHLRTCAGIKSGKIFEYISTWLLIRKIKAFAKTPISTEPNQLMCKVKVAGEDMVNLFKLTVPDWEARVDYYFCGWRNQSEISEAIKSGF